MEYFFYNVDKEYYQSYTILNLSLLYDSSVL